MLTTRNNTAKYLFFTILLLSSFFVEAACRSETQVNKFKRLTGFPKGRPGYVVDHICALAQGGIDSTINMQWQTVADSKMKDKVENTPIGKVKWCTPENSTSERKVFNCN